MNPDQIKRLSTVEIFFRDFRDSEIHENVIGYQVGGGAVMVARQDGITKIFPLDLVSEVKVTTPNE